jgi:hypothetical protein
MTGRADTFCALCVRLYWRRISTGHDREIAPTGGCPSTVCDGPAVAPQRRQTPPPSPPLKGRGDLGNYSKRSVIPESAFYYDGSGQTLLRAFAALCDKNSILTLTLKAHLVIDARYIAAPFAVIFFQQYFCDGFAAGDDFAQRVEIAGFIVTAAVQAIARGQAG